MSLARFGAKIQIGAIPTSVYSKVPNNSAGEINVQAGTFSKIIN